ncbi:MAG TPA: hypothetical protein VMT52_11200, partial [Planctomycetota bacterium]|nr:hypothetical protein [Planctomycetota bacterium]
MDEIRPTPLLTASRGPESPRRIGAYLAVGAVLTYLATWTGAFTFYLSFQEPLLAMGGAPGPGVLRLEPVTGSQASPSSLWSNGVGGAGAPLPPGRLIDSKSEGKLTRARLENGGVEADITVERHPRGFIAAIYRDQLNRLGIKEAGDLDDAALLDEIARESLERYRFSWPEAERQRYAARIISKMTLWETGPIERYEVARGA